MTPLAAKLFRTADEDTQRRLPFYDDKSTAAAQVVVERTLTSSDLQGEAGAISLSILTELFDHFGWNPDASLIQGDQERFYKRQW